MTLIALTLSGVLVALAIVHVLWGIGFWWPIRDEPRLVKSVIGLKGITRMPGPIPCALVAVGLIFAAVWSWFPHGAIRTVGLAVATLVFLGRGILSYLDFWRRMTPEQPFATFDRRYYGPFCLVIAAGFAVLTLQEI